MNENILTSKEFHEGLESLKSYVDEKFDGLKSYVDEKFDEVKIYVDEKTGELHDEMTEVRKDIQALQVQDEKILSEISNIDKRMDDLKFYSTMALGAVAVIVACLGFVPFVMSAINTIKEALRSSKRDFDAHIEEIVRRVLQEKGGV